MPDVKFFVEKLNYCLDEMNVPASTRERVSILSKMLEIPKQQAWSLLEGHEFPDSTLLQKITEEFEIEIKC